MGSLTNRALLFKISFQAKWRDAHGTIGSVFACCGFQQLFGFIFCVQPEVAWFSLLQRGSRHAAMPYIKSTKTPPVYWLRSLLQEVLVASAIEEQNFLKKLRGRPEVEPCSLDGCYNKSH